MSRRKRLQPENHQELNRIINFGFRRVRLFVLVKENGFGTSLEVDVK